MRSSKTPSTTSASVVPPPVLPSTLSGAELATAFTGRIEPQRTTMGYRLGLLLVLVSMLLLPLVYLAIIVGAVAGVVWYARLAGPIFSAAPPGRAMIFALVVYVAPLLAGSLLVVFMILPLFWRKKKYERPLWVDRREQPLLFAYVDNLCDAIGAPRPIRIDVSAAAAASAHIDNGLLGVLHPRLVLTVGLPLAQAMDLRQFTGVLAHELGHFSQSGSMRMSYAVHRINRWFLRLAYTKSGIDESLDSAMQSEGHWSVTLTAGFCKLVLSFTRLLLRLMATLSHGLSMHLSRHAEYDADQCGARIVGSEAMSQALESTPYVSMASDLAIANAQSGWKKRRLPDDLVVLTHAFNHAMPGEVKDKITAQLLAHDTGWFDTHPPLYQRIGRLKKLALKGVMKPNAAATCLFKDFNELSKLATISLYQVSLGPKLKPEHVVPTK